MYTILFFFIYACTSQTFLVLSDNTNMTIGLFDPHINKLKTISVVPIHDIYLSTCIYDGSQYAYCVAMTERDLFFVQINIYTGIILDTYVADIISLAFDSVGQIYSILFHPNSVERCTINYNNSIIKYVIPTQSYDVLQVSNLDYDDQSFIFVVGDPTKPDLNLMVVSASDWKILFNNTVPSEYTIIKIYDSEIAYLTYLTVFNQLTLTYQLVLTDIQMNTYKVIVDYLFMEMTTANYIDSDKMYSIMQNSSMFYWVETDLISHTYDAKQIPSNIKCILKRYV